MTETPRPRLRRLVEATASLLPFGALLAALGGPAGAARPADLGFREQSLELPGAPAALVPADLDGDGVRDLAVVVVYTEWDRIGVEEWTEMDQVEGLVEVLTIVPVLLDRREVRAYLGRPEGGFEAVGDPLPLPLSVLSLEPGPPGMPALALTDEGRAPSPSTARPARSSSSRCSSTRRSSPAPGRSWPASAWSGTRPVTASPICCCRRPTASPSTAARGAASRPSRRPGSRSPGSSPVAAAGPSTTRCPGSRTSTATASPTSSSGSRGESRARTWP
jgi:hypothetical protein